MMNKRYLLLVLLVFCQWHAGTAKNRREAHLTEAKDGIVYITSAVGKDIVIQPGYGGRVIINGPLQVCDADGCRDRLGSRKNPARSCRAILEGYPFAKSGVYYIKTNPTVTKVYCYMENIPRCGGGGWTTIMKTNGYLPTLQYNSTLWKNKASYHVTGGQSGVDHQETKLPTYWTMPFKSLCLGMKTTAQRRPNWIRLNYKASSLYSVIADGGYRSTSLGRNVWKTLVPGSSLQRNCNKEGFNAYHVGQRVRIGIISNQENDCKTPDSRIGFGGAGSYCRGDGTISTGNVAACGGDNGNTKIKTHGYILAQ